MKADVDNRELVYNQGADDHTLQEEKESQEKFKNCKRHGMVRCYLTEENSNLNDIPFKRNKKGMVRINVTIIMGFSIKCFHKFIIYLYINLKLNYLC